MQAKLVKIDLLALSESTLSFWRARAMFLIAHNLCWFSMDPRGHMADGKTNFYHWRVLIDSFAIYR